MSRHTTAPSGSWSGTCAQLIQDHHNSSVQSIAAVELKSQYRIHALIYLFPVQHRLTKLELRRKM
jgi:hypothetical protein